MSAGIGADVVGGALAGSVVIAVAGGLGPRGGRRAVDQQADRVAAAALLAPPADRRVGLALVGVAGVLGLVLFGLVAVVGVASVAALVVRVVRVQHRRRGDAAIARALPDLIDLFVVAASAGHPVARSLEVVSGRAAGEVAAALRGADERRQRGLRLDHCLARVEQDLGAPAVPLIDALRQSSATGVALGPLLHEVAADARDARRRHAQEAARRLPVTLLVPLAGCVLPAAVLLAVVPVVLVSFASLSG